MRSKIDQVSSQLVTAPQIALPLCGSLLTQATHPVNLYRLSRYVRNLCLRRKPRRFRCAIAAACGATYLANHRLSK